MFKSFRRLLTLGLLGVMLVAVTAPTFASPQQKKGGKKGSGKAGKKGAPKKGGRGGSR
jgi:hypothetical protein